MTLSDVVTKSVLVPVTVSSFVFVLINSFVYVLVTTIVTVPVTVVCPLGITVGVTVGATEGVTLRTTLLKVVIVAAGGTQSQAVEILETVELQAEAKAGSGAVYMPLEKDAQKAWAEERSAALMPRAQLSPQAALTAAAPRSTVVLKRVKRMAGALKRMYCPRAMM